MNQALRFAEYRRDLRFMGFYEVLWNFMGTYKLRARFALRVRACLCICAGVYLYECVCVDILVCAGVLCVCFYGFGTCVYVCVRVCVFMGLYGIVWGFMGFMGFMGKYICASL